MESQRLQHVCVILQSIALLSWECGLAMLRRTAIHVPKWKNPENGWPRVEPGLSFLGWEFAKKQVEEARVICAVMV